MLHPFWRTLLGAGALPLLLLVSCKVKPGDKCTGPGLPTCQDPNAALVCANAVVTLLPCRGPKACTQSSTAVECDNSIAAAGDACDQPNDVACALDHKSALECQNGKFALAEGCKGTRGCVVEGDSISCDNDVAESGDLCKMEGDYACTSDKLTTLKCHAHKFEPLSSCRGKDGCRAVELPQEKKTDFLCDDSLAQENDPCDTEGEVACSLDQTELYSCKSKHFSKDRACPGGCSFDDKGERFLCAAEAAAAGATSKPSKGTALAKTKAAPKPAKSTATHASQH